jgi:DNA polymerase III epsilon subunit-like protein
MIAFIDTEYTYDSRIRRNRLVSICILKYTNDALFDSEYNDFVKPDGWTVSAITTSITGISTKMLEDRGKNIIDIMNNVTSLMDDVTLFVAHNVTCDRNVIINEFDDCGILTTFADIKTYDTMTSIAGKMSLSKLHYNMFGETFQNGHDARADTFACARCYFRHKNKEMSYDIEYAEDTEPAFVPSEEQKNIVNACAENNTIVDAVPGSGKTTTCFAIAEAYPDERVLLLTYSRSLKDDVTKNKPSHIFNMQEFTFHGICGKMYGIVVNNDIKMHKCIYNNGKKRNSTIKYGKILIDEVQDMSEITYACISIAIETFSNENTCICVLGDENQCLYKYAGADSRYLTRANVIFINEREWIRMPLSTSFRLTQPIATFVNKCIHGDDNIVSVRDGVKPIYIYANAFDSDATGACNVVVSKILEYINMGYAADDIFILARSVKGNTKGDRKNTPVSRLSNSIQHAMPNIHIYSSLSDEKTSLDVKCSMNKLVITTYNQSKGRQRKIVIIYGIDNWGNDNPDTCPNAIYVALTRAQEHLVIVQFDNTAKLQYLKDDVSKYCNVIGNEPVCKEEKQKQKDDKTVFTVTELCSHLSLDNVIKCMTYFEHVDMPPIGVHIEITTYSAQTYEDGSTGIENVSAINGNAIPAVHHFNKTGKCAILDTIRNNFSYGDIVSLVGNVITNKILTQYTHRDMHDIEKMLRVCVAWESIQSNFGWINKQITECNWLSSDDIVKATANLDELKHSDNVKCEVGVSHFNVNGFIDCFDMGKRIIYEYKCTLGELKNEHIIQLAIYMAIIESRFRHLGIRYVVYNILSGQAIEITSTPERLNDMIAYLKHVKSSTCEDVDNKAFIDKCITTRSAILS